MKHTITSIHLFPSGGSSAKLTIEDGTEVVSEVTLNTPRVYPKNNSIDFEYCTLMAKVDKYLNMLPEPLKAIA